MSPSLAQSQASQSLGTKAPPSYDFEKRKRWADLLLTELVDNVPFVLSSTCKIWFCGVAVTEILGWRDTDLVDLDFIDLIELADQHRFRLAFEQAIENAAGFDISVRLKGCGDIPLLSYPILQSKAAVFDIKCHTHVIPPVSENEVEIRCLIAMVSPYPSRNTGMLDSMLDLKVQNDLLRRKLGEYRERGPPKSPSSICSPSSQSPMYATSSLHVTKNTWTSGSGSTRKGSFASIYHCGMVQRPSEGLKGRFSEAPDIARGSGYLYGPVSAEEQGDESSKKKKLKRSQNGEQYVCNKCGRTDSPEWRKGPLGPKTLCNACGLRWAKQTRRMDNSAIAAEDSLKANAAGCSADV